MKESMCELGLTTLLMFGGTKSSECSALKELFSHNPVGLKQARGGAFLLVLANISQWIKLLT